MGGRKKEEKEKRIKKGIRRGRIKKIGTQENCLFLLVDKKKEIEKRARKYEWRRIGTVTGTGPRRRERGGERRGYRVSRNSRNHVKCSRLNLLSGL